jgi:L-ascorbate metabolism protein UlaG (beta-lactamase superfamily)
MMDIEYKGGNTIVLTSKQVTVVVDPKLSELGLKDYSGKYDVILATQQEFAIEKENTLVIDGPGEYEVGNFSIVGMAAQRHIDTKDDAKKATIYRVSSGDINVGVVGHITGELTDEQLEGMGVLDVLIIPVGGNGYTLDTHEAVHIIRQVDPKIVIPTHYADQALKYEVDQAELEGFLKEIGGTHETVPKLKLKGGALPETLQVYEVTRTS